MICKKLGKKLDKYKFYLGEKAEQIKAHRGKVCVELKVTWVRITISSLYFKFLKLIVYSKI